MVNSLLNIFDLVLVSMLEEWLTDESLCYLDCACCNSCLRESLMQILSLCKIVHSDIDKKCSNEYLEWIALRQMRLTSVKLNKQNLKSLAALEFILKKTKSFDYVVIFESTEVLHVVKTHNIRVRLVEVRSRVFKESEKFLKVWSDVQSIYLPELVLSSADCFVIAALCPCLQEIRTVDESNIDPLIENSTALKSIVKGSVSLSALRIAGLQMIDLSAVTNEMLLVIADHCRLLTSITMGVDWTDASLSYLAEKCSMLTSLSVKSSYITDVSLRSLTLIARQLHTLKLSSSMLTDASMSKFVQQCVQLRVLGLSQCFKVSNKLVMALAHSTTLTELNVQGCSVDERSLIQLISNCHSLVDLKVTQRQWSDSLPALVTHKFKDVLSVKYCSGSKVSMFEFVPGSHFSTIVYDFNCASVVHLCLTCRLLRSFEATKCDIQDIDIAMLVVICTQLVHISLLECKKLTVIVFKHFTLCHELRSFTLKGFSNITPDNMTSVLSNQLNMRALALIDCKLSGPTVSRVIRLCSASHIVSLNISHNVVPSKFYRHLVKYCPQLTSIDLSYCNVSASLLPHLQYKRLKHLNLTGNPINEIHMARFEIISKIIRLYY